VRCFASGGEERLGSCCTKEAGKPKGRPNCSERFGIVPRPPKPAGQVATQPRASHLVFVHVRRSLRASLHDPHRVPVSQGPRPSRDRLTWITSASDAGFRFVRSRVRFAFAVGKLSPHSPAVS